MLRDYSRNIILEAWKLIKYSLISKDVNVKFLQIFPVGNRKAAALNKIISNKLYCYTVNYI